MALKLHEDGASEAPAEKPRVKPPPPRRTATTFDDAEENKDLALVHRVYSWFAMCQHPKAAYRWMSGMYMLFSVRICLAAFYPEKLAALPTYYNALLPVCWLVVLHGVLPLCLLTKDRVKEGISALARAKIQGRVDFDEDLCFKDPKLREKLWRHGQASRETQELAGIAFQLVGMFKLAKDCGEVTPGGRFDPISAQEVRKGFHALTCMA